MKNVKDQEYNGWTNYETWNVALWIQNDETLYQLAKDCYHEYSDKFPYSSFIEALKELRSPISSKETPDGVSWNDPKLDLAALNRMIGDL